MWLPRPRVPYLRPVPGFGRVQPWLEAAALRAWQRTHVPPPPRTVKAAAVRRHATAARSVFVESGTFFGSCGRRSARTSIACSPSSCPDAWAGRAQRLFAADAAVTILSGDSGALLGPLLLSVNAPAVLWLDGHYSVWLTARGETDTPVRREIEAALDSGTPDDVILIDDARLFGAHPGLPLDRRSPRLPRARHRPSWRLRVEDDVVRASAGWSGATAAALQGAQAIAGSPAEAYPLAGARHVQFERAHRLGGVLTGIRAGHQHTQGTFVGLHPRGNRLFQRWPVDVVVGKAHEGGVRREEGGDEAGPRLGQENELFGASPDLRQPGVEPEGPHSLRYQKPTRVVSRMANATAGATIAILRGQASARATRATVGARSSSVVA